MLHQRRDTGVHTEVRGGAFWGGAANKSDRQENVGASRQRCSGVSGRTQQHTRRGGKGAAGGRCVRGETGGRGARQPYLARSLLGGGGGRGERGGGGKRGGSGGGRGGGGGGGGGGEVEISPGCSGMRASMGGVGGCTLGGVEEHLREEDEPLRDTQEVSITLTPMLQWDRDAQPIKSREGVCDVTGGGGEGGGGGGSGVHDLNTLSGGKQIKREKLPCPSSEKV